MSAAAVILLAAGLFFVVNNFTHTERTEPGQVEYQVVQTVRGQRTTLKLSDGTHVSVNSNSSLRVPDNYGKQTRTLYLEGEAFFDVAHRSSHPFVVITNHTYTRVLGTEFNITAYDSNNVEVAVKEGKVSLGTLEKGRPGEKKAEISRDKLGIISGAGTVEVSDIREIDQYVGWTEGRLKFRRTPFPEVLERLQRWYDIDFIVHNSVSDLSERTLTATYDNMPLGEVLKVLSISMNVSYTREGRTVTFYKQQNQQNH
ncbi:MAG: FecR domain-containing protein [Balneolaceae bacterium]|nr:FecR domain-containing protein [Balneolaceae bacterium]